MKARTIRITNPHVLAIVEDVRLRRGLRTASGAAGAMLIERYAQMATPSQPTETARQDTTASSSVRDNTVDQRGETPDSDISDVAASDSAAPRDTAA